MTIKIELNSAEISEKRGQNPIDWITNTPLLNDADEDQGLRPGGLDYEEGPLETGSLPNVRPVDEDDDPGLAIDGPGFYGSDNQLFGPDVILMKAANEASLEDFWSM